MALVRAIKRGFCGKALREPGQVFEFSGAIGPWMEVVEEEPEAETPKPSKQNKKPEAPKPQAQKDTGGVEVI